MKTNLPVQTLEVASITGSEHEERAVKAALPDAPVPEQVAVPAGWLLSDRGVCKGIGKDHSPIPAPVVISGRLADTAEGTESLTCRGFCIDRLGDHADIRKRNHLPGAEWQW